MKLEYKSSSGDATTSELLALEFKTIKKEHTQPFILNLSESEVIRSIR